MYAEAAEASFSSYMMFLGRTHALQQIRTIRSVSSSSVILGALTPNPAATSLLLTHSKMYQMLTVDGKITVSKSFKPLVGTHFAPNTSPFYISQLNCHSYARLLATSDDFIISSNDKVPPPSPPSTFQRIGNIHPSPRLNTLASKSIALLLRLPSQLQSTSNSLSKLLK